MPQTEAPTATPDRSPPAPDHVFTTLIAAAIFAANLLVGVALIVTSTERDRPSPLPATAPATAANSAADDCEAVAFLYAIHGTDCRSMPVVTAPGALGPANTGGIADGTNWEPAYPGSNVWLPDYQISGRELVQFPGSAVLPPAGYDKIGATPDGAIIYWRPSGNPRPESPPNTK